MKKLIPLTLLAFILGFAVIWFAGGYLSKPVNTIVRMPKGYESVVANGTHGSFLGTDNRKVCALLMHGVRSNRTSMIRRSSFLQSLGISSLLIDLQAHGETHGERITFGVLESQDAENGVNYLRDTQGCKKVIAIGVSLGGASALLGNGPIKADAIVLESVFPTIEDAVADRIEMRLGKLGRIAAPLLYGQIPLRIDADLSDIRPIEKLDAVKVPLFIISGTLDKHTKIEETLRMFKTANEPKQLWLVEGADHQNLHAYNPNEYETKIADFIQKYLL